MRGLAVALAAALSWGGAVNIPLKPLPAQTVPLGGGLYQVYNLPGLKVMAYSAEPLEIARDARAVSTLNVDLDALPSTTQQTAPGQYVVGISGIVLIIETPAPVGIVPAPPVQGEVREDRGHSLSTFPGLPSDITGSFTAVETPTSVIFSYSLINLGNRSYTLGADDLSLQQSGYRVSARLERRSGNLTPGLLEPGKGEIGRITVPKTGSAAMNLVWVLRSGSTSYTLRRTYELQP